MRPTMMAIVGDAVAPPSVMTQVAVPSTPVTVEVTGPGSGSGPMARPHAVGKDDVAVAAR